MKHRAAARRRHRWRARCSPRPRWRETVPPPTISVTGEATVSVAPDLAQIDGGVTSEAKTAREASDANNAAMGKVLLALKGAGIEEKDFQTSRLSLQPQSAPNRCRPAAAIVGYRASNRVTIRLRDVSKVASVIDTLVGAGANDIGGINFIGVQRLETSRRGPRTGGRRCPPQGRDLCQGRRRHARRAAQHLGGRLARPDAFAQDGGRHGGVATPVAQGEETLPVTVSVSWAIKQAAQ